jgi:PEP-CTERM motif
MSKFRLTRQAALAVATLACSLGSAQAVTATLYGTQASFLGALGGPPTASQNFDGFAVGTNLAGVQVLPGVTMSTNLANIDVFNSVTLGNVAFATTRNLPEAFYDINVNNAYRAFGFEINAYDPNTAGPGFLSFEFADGDTTYTFIPVLPPATETTALFFGVIADQPITKIRWSEGPEINFSCCEETVIDNLIAAHAVPEPAAGLMLTLGLGAVGWLARRRKPGA